MDVYAIANQKGGVGKTTVTLGLSAELARRAWRVLVIDLDPQASATKVLAADVEEQHTVADVMLEPERFPLRDVIVPTEWGFDLAASETALASRESRRAPADEFILRRQLDPVDGYDLVLIDCPPSLGLLTINALAAASRLILATEPSFLALQGLEELLDTLELVRTHYNPRLQLAGVVVNRCERTVEHRESCTEIERYFADGPAWRQYVAKRTVLQDATRRGVPVHRVAGRPAAEVGEAFADLAGRIGTANGAS